MLTEEREKDPPEATKSGTVRTVPSPVERVNSIWLTLSDFAVVEKRASPLTAETVF